MIYLDHNSTSPMLPSVIETMNDCYRRAYANPASQHRSGQTARAALENYRSQISEMLGACASGMQRDELIFTSGGTESDNLALFGLTGTGHERLDLADGQYPRVIVSSVEHPAIEAAARQLAGKGYDVRLLPVDSNGLSDPQALVELLKVPTALVSIMLANNETGVIQPIPELAQICRKRNVLFHTDAVQAVGKIDVNFHELGVDALSFTAHKLGGPRGIGGLLVRHGIKPQPLLFGGFQQLAIRPGTEDVALVAGLWQAIKCYCDSSDERTSFLRLLRDHFESRLMSSLDGIVINGSESTRTPQTSNIAFPEVNRQNFLMAADLAGLAISTGSACASGSSDPSPVLMAMDLPKSVVDSSVRISVGYSNSIEEIDEATEKICKIIRRSKH